MNLKSLPKGAELLITLKYSRLPAKVTIVPLSALHHQCGQYSKPVPVWGGVTEQGKPICFRWDEIISGGKSSWKPASQLKCGNVGRGYSIKGKVWTAQCKLQAKHCSLSLWKWMILRPEQDSQSLSLPLPAKWLALETSAVKTVEPRLWCWWEIVLSQFMLSFHWYSIFLSTLTQKKAAPGTHIVSLCPMFPIFYNFSLVLKVLIKTLGDLKEDKCWWHVGGLHCNYDTYVNKSVFHFALKHAFWTSLTQEKTNSPTI